jgi:hypothetical protein
MNCAQQEDSAHFRDDAPWVREILCQHASDVASSPFTNDQTVRPKDQNPNPNPNPNPALSQTLAQTLTLTLTLARYGSSSRMR